MKDLDFDELDKAVNSLISGDTKPASTSTPTPTVAAQPTAVTPAEPVATLTPPTLPVEPPTPIEPPIGSTPVVEPVATVEPLAARRSTGRFMDVVHPSSDMRTSSTPPTPPVVPATETVAAPVTPEVITPVPPTPAPTLGGGARDWPDPIDFQSSTTPTPPAPVINATSDAPVMPVEPTPPAQPQVSPFLSDTKVDKRPLGAFSTSGGEPTSPTAPITAPSPALDSNKEDHPIGQDTPMPAELQDDLLHIESDSESTPVATSAPDETPIGPTSITQQYKEQTSSAPQTSGAIFDTNSYHKPLAHPAKKKSGWTWIVWVLILLVVGGGIGAAVYFLVLPKL